MKEKKVMLTKEELNGIYELLTEYLFNPQNPPKIGCFGISPNGYVGLIHLFERLPTNKGRKKTNYKELLKKLCQQEFIKEPKNIK